MTIRLKKTFQAVISLSILSEKEMANDGDMRRVLSSILLKVDDDAYGVLFIS